MISYLQGEVLETTDKYLVLQVGGIGYKVYATPATLLTFSSKQKISLYTYLSVREDALDLYGFQEASERSFFELLIGVSGIGPRGALGILSLATVPILERAIATGDTQYMTKVSGIGRKTAEKIILELRDKMTARTTPEGGVSLRGESDTVEALRALGYSQNEARDAVKHISDSITDTNTRIKEALKILGGK